MTWLDFVTLLGFGLFTSLGYKRGVVLEIADLLCILVGGFLAFRLYRPLASALHGSVFKGFGLPFLERFCLITVFVVVCLVVFGVGLNIQRRVKEDKVLDRDVDQRLGLVVGFFKTSILVVLLLGFMFYNEAFPERETARLKRGPVVSLALGLQSFVRPLVYVIAPSDLAEAFMKKGLGTRSAG